MNQPQPPNYLPRIQALVARQVIRVGDSFEVDVRHEPPCRSYVGESCDCNPVLLVWTRPALPEPEPAPAPPPAIAPPRCTWRIGCGRFRGGRGAEHPPG